MRPKSLADQAAQMAARIHKIHEPAVLDCAEARHPESGKPVHRFKVASAANANGPACMVFLDDSGEAIEVTDQLAVLFDRPVVTVDGAPASISAPVTIQPVTNTLTLNPGDAFLETITVTIPKNAGPAKADIYFLADTTGSMSAILGAVQAGANNILGALSALGADLMFGVGNYKDFESRDPYAFERQVSLTNAAPVVAGAINSWSAAGGGDIPEADLFGLDSLAVPPGGSIGWRAGSKRIIVWFGDAPGHDPICAAVSGGAAITEASVTAKLVAEGMSVLAISTANPGLDDDPKKDATGYVAKCGPPGGTPGQGTRIANASGGKFVTGINAGNIVNAIIGLVSGAVGSIQNVKLLPSSGIASFVASISPAAGYGPLAGDQEHTLRFDVTFTGTDTCHPQAQVFSGTLDVVADGNVVASKKVEITVPACVFVYSVKFVCGEQPECGCECTPVQPGKYATEINIHNYGIKEIEIVKHFIPVVLAGAPVGREPHAVAARAEDKIVLQPQSATMDDCCRISELLIGGEAPTPMPLTIGLLEITASAEVAVTAVYTTSGLKHGGGGVSIRVQQIARR
jgi:hypothetical protein